MASDSEHFYKPTHIEAVLRVVQRHGTSQWLRLLKVSVCGHRGDRKSRHSVQLERLY